VFARAENLLLHDPVEVGYDVFRTGPTYHERCPIRPKPSVRTQVTRIIEKLLRDWEQEGSRYLLCQAPDAGI
jgi:hypothetical protein